MGHVRRADFVVQPVEDRAVRPVDGEESAAHVGELVVGQVGHVDVCVLQPGVGDQPHVGEAEREAVEQRHGAAARLGRPRAEHGTHGHDADVGAHDLLGPRGGPERRVEGLEGHEVVGGAVLGPARGAPEQVGRPADAKVQHQLEQTPRPLAKLLCVLELALAALVLDAGAAVDDDGHVRLALGDVVRVRVVHRVRALPREVRHEQDRVEHVPNRVLQLTVVGEGAVAALVRDDPHARPDGAGHRRPRQPQRRRDPPHRDETGGGEARGRLRH
mmetsp:Transcript_60253/g.144812  ORF Transcript_60253/g.144812 Transcript_60253/m.144812 type:complete len:273 (-) Transcript_60253:341-1159(-)